MHFQCFAGKVGKIPEAFTTMLLSSNLQLPMAHWLLLILTLLLVPLCLFLLTLLKSLRAISGIFRTNCLVSSLVFLQSANLLSSTRQLSLLLELQQLPIFRFSHFFCIFPEFSNFRQNFLRFFFFRKFETNKNQQRQSEYNYFRFHFSAKQH